MKGGKREGAGRPSIIEGERLQRVTVMLPASYVEWARSMSIRGNVSEGLRRLLEELDQIKGLAGHAAAPEPVRSG